MSYPVPEPPLAFKQFETVSTIDGGAEVIDCTTGHPLDRRDSLRSAAGKAYRLNLAAAHGNVEGALGARKKR